MQCRYGKAWDFVPEFGLVMAGGREEQSKTWNQVEISEDFGTTFTELKELQDRLAYACLVIADETIFVAGGQRSKKNYLLTLSKEVCI